MSTENNIGQKKAVPRSKPKTNGNLFVVPGASGNNVSKEMNFDALRMRLFETQRIKKEFNLDRQVVTMLEDYGRFLEHKFGQEPSVNGIVETLIIQSLNTSPEYQAWIKSVLADPVTGKKVTGKPEKESENSNNNFSDDEDTLLENLMGGEKSGRVAGA